MTLPTTIQAEADKALRVLDRMDLALQLLAERDAAVAELAKLSRRQSECVRLSLKGLTFAQIGAMLGVSDRTVEKHMQAASDKLNLSRPEMVVLAARAGWCA